AAGRCPQLETMADHLAVKRANGGLYQDLLVGTPRLQLPLPKEDSVENIYWVFGVVLADSVPFEADEAMRRLAEYKIGTRPFFWPMHEQPVLRHMGFFSDVRCPVASLLARRGFYLPSGLGLRRGEIGIV